MDASVCGTMTLFTCGVHIDSICIHARFRVCSSLLGVDSGALSRAAASVNIGSVSARPLDPTTHSGCTSVWDAAEGWEALWNPALAWGKSEAASPKSPPSTFSSLSPLIGQLGVTWLLYFSPPSLCFVARKTHTPDMFTEGGSKHAKHSAGETLRVHLKVASLFPHVCVCASRRRTFTPEGVSHAARSSSYSLPSMPHNS